MNRLLLRFRTSSRLASPASSANSSVAASSAARNMEFPKSPKADTTEAWPHRHFGLIERNLTKLVQFLVAQLGDGLSPPLDYFDCSRSNLECFDVDQRSAPTVGEPILYRGAAADPSTQGHLLRSDLLTINFYSCAWMLPEPTPSAGAAGRSGGGGCVQKVQGFRVATETQPWLPCLGGRLPRGICYFISLIRCFCGEDFTHEPRAEHARISWNPI
jgi:hypothetical protein